MVKRAFPLLALPALLLAGCSFFTASLFPGYLAQTEESFDLNSKIEGFLGSLGGAGIRWYSQAFVLTTGADADYSGVLVEIDSLPNKLLLLADSAGNLQMLDDPDFGNLHLLDANGNFVVGQNQFPPASLASAAPVAGIIKEYIGFSSGVGGTNYLLHSDGMYSNQLQWQSFSGGWGNTGSGGPNIDNSQYGFEIRAVWYDSTAAADKAVAMVFFNYQLNRVYVFRTPIPEDMVAPLTASYPPVILENVDGGRVQYTRKGIVLADSDGSAALLDFNGQETGKRLDLGRGGEVRIAFDIAGDHFCIFDPDAQMLYQGNTGW